MSTGSCTALGAPRRSWFQGNSLNLPLQALHAIVLEHFMVDTSRSPLRLALIGMSGVGKTFWTKRLAQAGRPTICCDDRIEQRLHSRLASGGLPTRPRAAPPLGPPRPPTPAAPPARDRVRRSPPPRSRLPAP